MEAGYNVSGMRVTSKKGFTLVELLIVISVIGVLSSMTVFTNISKNLQRSRDGRRQTDIEAIRSALEIYRSDKSSYPTSTAGLSGYITTVPTDPSTKAAYVYTASPAGCDGVTTKCTTYTLCANLELVKGACSYRATNP